VLWKNPSFFQDPRPGGQTASATQVWLIPINIVGDKTGKCSSVVQRAQ